MSKLIIEHSKDGVFFYHETERHFRKVDKKRRDAGLVRLEWEDLGEDCCIEVGEYMVVPIVEVEE